MFRNYLKVTYRSLLRHKLSSIINVLGLSIGVGICLLLIVYVRNELAFDSFHEKRDRIYRGWTKEEIGADRIVQSVITPMPFGPALKENFPEVDAYTLFLPLNWKLVNGDQKIDITVHMVSPDFFNMFSFQVLEGQVERVLEDPSNIVITENAAIKHFGQQSAVGQTIAFGQDEEERLLTVRAVIGNPPSNSTLQFNYLISDVNKSTQFHSNVVNNWFAILGESYVLLNESNNLSEITRKFPAFVDKVIKKDDPDVKYEIGLQPLQEIHTDLNFPVGLAPVTDARYAYILAGMAGLILLIACINFVTLSIGKSLARAKEVGLRKVVGAARGQLIQQHLTETIVLVLLGTIGGLLLARLLLPYFNELSGRALEITLSPFLVGILCGLIVLVAFVAGSYPAFVISSLEPVAIMKGNFQGVNTKNKLRKILLGIQFTFSLGLVSGLLIMSAQLKFLQEKNLGYEKEQVITIPLNVRARGIASTINKGMEKAKLFVDALGKSSSVINVAATSQEMGDQWIRIGFTTLENQYKEFNLNVVSPEYVSTMKMNVVEGRDFQQDNAADIRRSVLVNEAFVKEFNLKDPVGKKIPGPNFNDHEIVGVIEDFNFQSLHGKVKPVVMVQDYAIISGGFENINISSGIGTRLLVRFIQGKEQEVFNDVKNAWTLINGNEELNYSFLNERLNNLYKNEENLRAMVTNATVVSIILGSLGLFAFASLSIHNKIKELSIRKIMGATEVGLFILVSREYLYLILISLVVSVPFTWYLLAQWLNTFAYRIGINPIYFLATGAFSIVLALLIISYHALTAAKTQPAQNLRVE